MISANLTGYGQQSVGDKFDFDDIEYEITSLSRDKEVRVYKYNGTATEVSIPTKVNDQGIDYRVTAIGNEAFSGHGKAEEDKLTSVDMPHTVTSIGESAFRNNNLTEVVIPVRVNSIGDSAFHDNSDLQTVIIRPDGADGASYLNAPNLSQTNPFSNPAPAQIDLLVPTGMEDHYSGRGWTNFGSTNPATFTGDGDGITYAITSIAQGKVEIAGYDASTATERVTIPQTVTDQGTEYKVTAIGYQAFSDKQLTQVTFSNTPTTPSNVTSIGEDAFYLSQLDSVDIPNSVTSIGQRAFGESRITELTLPNSITTISQWAFSRNNYTELTIPASVDSIGYQAFYENTNLKLVTVEAVSPPTLDPNAFDGSPLNQIDVVVPEVAIDEYRDPDNGWTRFKSIIIGTFTDTDNGIKYVIKSSSPPEVEITDYDNDDGTATVVNIPSEVKYGGTDYKVTAIGDGAFERKQLTEVNIPNSVTSIGDFALRGNQLTEVTLPDSVTRIGDFAFADNTLTELTIPSSVTSIGEKAFWIEENVKFEGNGLTRLTFADQGNLNHIGRWAFMNNRLTEVTIPSSLTSTEPDVFQSNELTQVNFSTPSNLTSINEGVFKGNKLTSVTIPDGVESIGNSAFARNDGLTQVTLPGSVTSIDLWAFSRSTTPTSPLLVVSLEATRPPSLALKSDGSGEPFGDRSLVAVDVPRGGLEDYHTNDDWTRTGFTSIGIFTDKDIKYGITDVTPNEVMVLDYTGSAAGVDIPGTVNDNNDNNETYTVTSIGQQAFKDKQLTEVTLPNTVTHIGGFAFANNQLNSVTLPVGVTRIDSVAFMDNPNLALVIMEGTTPPRLHADAFQNAYRYQIDVIIPRGTPAGSIKTAYEAAEWTGFASLEEGIALSIEGASEVESLSPFDITFQFTTEVTGFTIDDISLRHATLSDFTGGGSRYTVKVTPTTCEGVIEITVPGDVAEYTPGFLSLAASATVTVNASPSAPAVSSPSVEYCVGETATALTATGDNLLWYTSKTGGTGEATAPIPGTANAGSTTHYVSQTTNGCESDRAEIVVNVVEVCPAQIGDVFTVSGIAYEITSIDPDPNEVKVVDYISSATAVEIPRTVDDEGETYTVTAIGANAFRDKQLTEVTIPNSVTSIGDGAFVDNTDLDLVTVKATHPPSLHENAFTDRGQIDLVVPSGTGIQEDYLKEGWTGFKSISDGTVVLSIGEPGKDNFTLYPNPARDKVYIALGPGQELKQVNIYTMIGAFLYSENGPEINTARLPRGTYFFEIVTKTGDRSMRRVIIQ